jgi:hypothetical protein
MADIYNKNGELVASDIPISEKQQQLLNLGIAITMDFHTPQLMRHKLGNQTGTFQLSKENEKIVTPNAEVVKSYAILFKAITAYQADEQAKRDVAATRDAKLFKSDRRP